MNARQRQAIKDLTETGADKLLIEAMRLKVFSEFCDSSSLREDRQIRARMDLIKDFESALMRAGNER